MTADKQKQGAKTMTNFNATIQKVQARFNCDKGAAIAIIGRMRWGL